MGTFALQDVFSIFLAGLSLILVIVLWNNQKKFQSLTISQQDELQSLRILLTNNIQQRVDELFNQKVSSLFGGLISSDATMPIIDSWLKERMPTLLDKILQDKTDLKERVTEVLVNSIVSKIINYDNIGGLPEVKKAVSEAIEDDLCALVSDAMSEQYDFIQEAIEQFVRKWLPDELENPNSELRTSLIDRLTTQLLENY